MNRTRVFLSVCSLLLIVLTVNLSAQEEGSGLVFTGCPPYVEGDHCDSMFYQVVAIDIGTGKKCPEAKYFIVSGPGEINERTGLWVFHPEEEDLPPYYQDVLEIAAYHGNDTTTADQNCRFDVRVHDLYPTFEGYCGAHITVLPGESIEVPLEVTDADPCHTPEFESVQIVPEPAGVFMFDSTGFTITFAPDLADAGQTFEVTISVVSGPMTIGCGLYLDVFEPEPIRFRIATETENDVEPGDTVRVDVLVDAAPVDMDRLDLLLKYDSDLMSFIGAVPGTPFFSPDSGCGWPYFDCRAVYGCGTASGQSIILRARATDRGSPAPPICYRPDQFPAVLATLDFVITDNLMPGEQFTPIDFYWCSCTSNVMFAPAKTPLFMPSAVFSPDGELIQPDGIPGPSGASDDCYFHGVKNIERIRQIEFQNGGVRIGVPALPGAYSVRMGMLDDQLQGQFSDMPIMLEEIDSTQGLGGFDLLLGYDASALVFQLAYEGDLYDSCGWEYFTYRFGAHGGCGMACPSGMLRVIGVAETNNGPYYAGCDDPFPGYVQPGQLPISLAVVRFLISNDINLAGQFVPMRFFWYDCGDNILCNHDGSEVYLSARVFDENDTIISREDDFPTYFGARDECVNYDPSTGKFARRNIDFHNGGVQIKETEPVDARGDINLNGLAYEIADAVMFSNYFVEGLSAFGSHWEGSIAASDCNADGITLTIADFVYMIRVIVGDAPPSPAIVPSPNPAYFNWDQANSTVSVTTPDSLGAVYLVIEGEITPTLLADHMDMKFGWDTGWTRILIYSYEFYEFISSGPLVSVEGSTGLISVETATYEGRPVTSVIGGVSEPAPYSVRLGFVEDQLQGQYAEIPVGLETMSDSHGLGGFDFVIGYDASALSFQMANEGSILDICGWEYFTYRAGPNIPCEGYCPSGLVRVLGLAEINNGPMYAGCDDPLPGYVQPDQLPGTLATLNFLVSNDQTLECMVVPLRFFWIDCGDNTLANFDGQELFVSASVFDMDGSRIDAPAEFPTFRGAQEECVFSGQTTGMSAVRWVDYYNGGVAIMCADPIDVRGDINLNAIPFEIADAVMFSNYFIVGLAAFGSHVEGSINGSDCNADGITLTVSDFVYLIRVMNGELSPTPVPGGTCPGVALKANSQEIRVSTDDSLGAVYLVVSGHVTPTLLAPGMEMIYAYQEGYTRVLIYSFEAGHFISDGPLVSFNGEWNLVSIELSSYTGLPCVGGYPTGIDDIESGNMPAEFALHANYPNPFNPNTTIEYDLPEQASVEIVVYNITGQRVQTLVDGVIGAGRHTTFWDGTDASGRHVSSGIYFYRITAGNYTQARKMLLLK